MENLQQLLASTGGPAIEQIIDVGAGSGSTLKRLHEEAIGSRYVAVDVQARLPEAVRRALPNVAVETLVVDTESLPFEDDEFDLGLLSHVIEHIPDPRAVIYETARVARLVYVEVPLEGNKVFRVARALRSLGGAKDEPGGHVLHLTTSSLRQLVEESGLSVLATRLYYPERLLCVNDASASRLKVRARRFVSHKLGPDFVARHYNGFAGVLATMSTARRAGPGAN